MRAGELAADLGDLLGGLAGGEHDLWKPDAAEAVEVERVVGPRHGGGILIRNGRLRLVRRFARPLDNCISVQYSILIRIDLDSPVSLEEQIRGEIRAAIARNEIRAGQSLPSVRQLGADLGIHWNTVARAYRRLRDEGLIRFGQGRGAVVRRFSRPDAPTGSFERERIRLQLRDAVTDARFDGLTLEDIREIFRGELKQFRA